MPVPPVSLDEWMSSDNAKLRATAPPHLDWQGELDSALADLDQRLTHPRRRATDSQRQPVLPELGQAQITNEVLDEIAWRVAEQIRRQGHTVAPHALAEALTEPPPPAPQTVSAPEERAAATRVAVETTRAIVERRATAPPSPARRDEAERMGLAPGKMVMIRFKMPALWPLRLFGRRSDHGRTNSLRTRA